MFQPVRKPINQHENSVVLKILPTEGILYGVCPIKQYNMACCPRGRSWHLQKNSSSAASEMKCMKSWQITNFLLLVKSQGVDVVDSDEDETDEMTACMATTPQPVSVTGHLEDCA
jgi:hypothetical protein